MKEVVYEQLLFEPKNKFVYIVYLGNESNLSLSLDSTISLLNKSSLNIIICM